MSLEKILEAPDRFLLEQHKKAADYLWRYFGWTKYECQKVYLGIQILGLTGFGAPAVIGKYRATGDVSFGPVEYFCATAAVVQGLNILLDKHEEKRRAYLEAFNSEGTSQKNNPTPRERMPRMIRPLSLVYFSVGLYAASLLISDPEPFKGTQSIMHDFFPSVVPEEPTILGFQIASGMMLSASLVLGTYFSEQPMHSPYHKKPFFETAYSLLRNYFGCRAHGTKA